MFSVTTRLEQFGTTLACSHVCDGQAPPKGSVTLVDHGYVRLCAECDALAHQPGALKYRLPERRHQEAKANPHRRHIDDYIAEHTG